VERLTIGGLRHPTQPSLNFPQAEGRTTAKHAREEDTQMLAFFKEEDGQGLVEYALIIAVIAIAVIVAMIFLRGQLQNIFSNIGNNLT
jgi:pilus assembly protein Flp/PilA